MGPSRSRRHPLRWLVLGVVAIGVAVYLAAFAFASDRLPQDTTVAGVDVGGMRPDRAERALRSELGPRLDDPVELAVEDRAFDLDPEAAGLSVDLDASVAQVPVGRSWNPADMWEVFVGGGDYDVVVRSAGDSLDRQLERVGEQVARPVVEGSVELGPGGPVPTYPRPGARIDVQDAVARVLAAYPTTGDEPVRLPLEEVRPALTRQVVDDFVDEVATPALAAPVTFEVDGEQVVVTPDDFAPALRAVTEDGELRLDVDQRRLAAAVRPVLDRVAERPREATFRIVGGEPRVVPSRPGVTVGGDALVEAFLAAAGAEGERRREVPTASLQAELTTQEARGLGVREKVSEFTTYYPHEDYRNVNIGRAAQLVDGTVLEPGETFSLNETVGERTRENGFTEGFIISDGVFKEDLGGGVSQMATTTFNAMFFAGLEDVEHKPHSFYIDRYPVGREATVAWPTVDLRFRNDTDHGVFITTKHVPSTYGTQGSVTVQMWSTKVWDVTSRTGERYAYTSPDTRYLTGDDCVPNVGYSGFSIDVVRVFRRVGESAVHHTERFSTVYTPSDSVVCQ